MLLKLIWLGYLMNQKQVFRYHTLFQINNSNVTGIQKCKLNCLSLQTGEIFHSGENLIDGTKCSYDDEGDICVQVFFYSYLYVK